MGTNGPLSTHLNPSTTILSTLEVQNTSEGSDESTELSHWFKKGRVIWLFDVVGGEVVYEEEEEVLELPVEKKEGQTKAINLWYEYQLSKQVIGTKVEMRFRIGGMEYGISMVELLWKVAAEYMFK